jgi:hypothetical protein
MKDTIAESHANDVILAELTAKKEVYELVMSECFNILDSKTVLKYKSRIEIYDELIKKYSK